MIEWKEKVKNPEMVVFSELRVTDTFFVDFYEDDEIFIKIREYDDTNAVSLKKGTPHSFDDNQIVHPVDLIVEYSART